jgi:AcrR family transcriptional regulator
MSMRSLAGELGVNVATLYHYFPSKADLLEEVIAHQSYEQLVDQVPAIDASLPAPERLERLVLWIWEQMSTQDDMWRLLLGESLRGEIAALSSAAGLIDLFEGALQRWLTALVPEVGDDVVIVSRVLRGMIFGFYIELLALPFEDRMVFLRRRAVEIGLVIAGR